MAPEITTIQYTIQNSAVSSRTEAPAAARAAKAAWANPYMLGADATWFSVSFLLGYPNWPPPKAVGSTPMVAHFSVVCRTRRNDGPRITMHDVKVEGIKRNDHGFVWLLWSHS